SLDSLGGNRATLMQRLPAAMQLGEQNSKAKDAGQNDMFGLVSDERTSAQAPAVRAVELPEWSESVRLTGERETLGLYLTGHPIGRFESGLARLVSHRIGDLVSDRPVSGMEGARFGGGKPVTIAGLIDEVKKRGSRVILTLDDRTGRIEVTLFDDVFQKYRDLITKDAVVLVEGKLRFDEFSDAWRLSGQRLTELDKVREQQARRLVLKWPQNGNSKALLGRLAEVLTPWRPGPCPITVEYTGAAATGALTLGNEWTVRASRELLEQLETLVGRGGVQVFYGSPPAISASSMSGN
ncbi:MAG: OB-fold nucleic acid binding domain-containing protein, partial [Steroidobacteraceae bacterium]